MQGQSLKESLEKLFEKAKKGDMGAFETIYRECFTPVFRYIYLRVKSKTEAEDLAQTVFLKAYQSLSNFKARGRPLLAYFFTIARNTVIDHWRKNREFSLETHEKDLVKLTTLDNTLDERLDQKNNLVGIKKALAFLTEDQQEVLIMKFINELSNKEISDLLGRSEEAVRQLQCRGLKTLRKYLKNLEI